MTSNESPAPSSLPQTHLTDRLVALLAGIVGDLELSIIEINRHHLTIGQPIGDALSDRLRLERMRNELDQMSRR